jgi:hypothetical protein
MAPAPPRNLKVLSTAVATASVRAGVVRASSPDCSVPTRRGQDGLTTQAASPSGRSYDQGPRQGSGASESEGYSGDRRLPGIGELALSAANVRSRPGAAVRGFSVRDRKSPHTGLHSCISWHHALWPRSRIWREPPEEAAITAVPIRISFLWFSSRCQLCWQTT